uniref:Uncharacterized protein n=1 Tax=Oncorhynchus kisutch TaxID=8019 RepID=A0A8C7FLK2_ONCKI
VVSHIIRLRGKLGWSTEIPDRRIAKGTKKDPGEYVYCLMRNRGDLKIQPNPYDLQVVSVQTAKQSCQYWTVSASCIFKLDKSTTYSLIGFCEAQTQQCAVALRQLHCLHHKVATLIRAACLKVHCIRPLDCYEDMSFKSPENTSLSLSSADLPCYCNCVEECFDQYYFSVILSSLNLFNQVIRGALKKLDKDIFTVEEFVEHLTFLSRISVQIPTLERQYQFLIQLYSMAKEYQITISPEELALYQHLVPSFQHLKSTVMICETKRDDNIFKFSVDLGKHLNQLRYELVLVKMKVNNPILLCSYTSPKVANEILQALSEEVAIYSNKAYSYTSYGELLRNSFSMKKISTVVRMKQGRGSNAAEVEAELSEVDYALTLRKMLWGMQKEWDKHYSQSILYKVIDLWRNTDFRLITHQSDASTVKIIASADDVMAQLEESQTTIMSIKASRYAEPIKTQIMFTKDCQESFSSERQLEDMVVVKQQVIHNVEELADLVSEPLPCHQQATLEALLTILVHCRDILSHLLQNRITSVDDFEWTRQLQYVWYDSTSLCYVVHAQASFMYGYEYLGCSPRLVITPLTDRCWLTLTGALSLHLGGAPAGPSGTGKTETVKDLAKVNLSNVFNIYCFYQRFMFEGRDIRLNASCGFFITMNPGCKGRVDLPDNLKSLFRPVSMMVPDFDLIAEIMLFSEGFKSAKSLSRKIVNLYQLASKQLSQQDHYDFGMRAIKSVLVLAGQKRRFAALSCGLTPEDECCVLICALQNSNLPKLVPEDVPLFKSIMEDLFPGVINPKTIHPQLEVIPSKATEILGFQQWPNQAEKVTQLYSQILVRGVMLIGPTGGGKTTVRLILQHALHLLPSLSELAPSSEVHVESFTINPKCVSFGELYGQVDPNTLEWSDGLFASAVRTYYHTTFENVIIQKYIYLNVSLYYFLDNFMVDNWRWIIMDGPVDILWVENLNTVLDDNKMLCLVNGERISLPDGIRFLFEVDTLSQATPATISRCAMVYMDPVDLGWKPYVRRWLSQLPRQLSREGRNHIQQLFDNSITQGLNFVKKHQKLLNFQIPEMSTVMTVCSILGALINFMQGNGGLGRTIFFKANYCIFPICDREDNKWFLQKNPEKLTILLGKLFVFSYAWAVGGVLNHVDDYDDSPSATKDKSCHLVNVAHAFKNLIHKLFEGAPCGVSLPAGNRMIFNYFVDLQTGAFVPWDELVPSTESLIRKETDTNKQPNCTARTTTAYIQAHMLQNLVKKGKNNLGAPKNKSVLVFVDDLNMPTLDSYGAQPSMEFIRQFIELQGVFDAKTLTWKGIQDVTLCAACAPPGGGRQSLSPRLLRHFSVLLLPHPSSNTMQHIFQIGLDGTGKEECVTLACHVSGSHLYRLSVCRNCSYSDFRDDLKRVFRQAGIQRKNTVLLITDSDIESVLEDLNCILKYGDVPGLFDNDEIDSITVDLKSTMESSIGENREEMYSYFIEVQLHIVLALSPAGMRLRQYCWAHPALLSCCNIDWYSEWSKDALLQVNLELQLFTFQVLQNKVARVCVDIHQSSTQMAAQYLQEMRRPYYIVPSTFIEYIDTFTKMCRSEGSKDRFSNGLSILSEATSLVTVMQDELLALGPQIEEKSKEIEILMGKLKEDSQAVEQVRAIVKIEEDMMVQETRIVHEYAEDATADLNKVLPLLEKAVSALDALQKSDISEIRVYTKPPELVLTVMHAVCILLQQRPDWTTAKQLLGDPGFLKRLVSLDKDSLPEKVFLKLRRYSKCPDFNPAKVGMVSIACRSMCLWVLALEHYHEVYKIIEPKRNKVNVAQAALVKSESNLMKKQKRLSKVRHWQNTGLPPDQNSTENALIVKNGPHWPLLIDPQGQATRWISSMEGVRSYKLSQLLSSSSPAFSFSSPLSSLSHRRLYLATCLPNPHFLPAVCVLVKLINFSVEYECLQEQLLSSAVSLYQPELELHHNQLLHTITADLFSLHELENRSLLLLQDTQGHILDDQDLVDNLKKSKVTSNEISVRVETAKDKEKEIDEVRKKYLPIANRGADLYFVLADLTQINYMYQFSLDWFNDIFSPSILSLPHSLSLPLRTLSPPLSPPLYSLPLCTLSPFPLQEVSLALFVDDQVVFSFLMCCNIMKTNKHNMIVGSTDFLPAEEWKIFLHSAVLSLKGSKLEHLNSMWAQCQYLCAHLPCFATLYKSIQTNRLQWELFQQARNLYEFLSEPYTGHAGESSQSAAASKDRHLPKCVHIFPWEKLKTFSLINMMNPVEAVFISQVKILRPECLNTAVKAFVIEKMGSKYLEVGKISLREVYERCSANVPIVFLLSPAYIENMPDKDLAEVFGIDSSAETLILQNQTQQLLHTIVNLQPRLSDSSLLVRWVSQGKYNPPIDFLLKAALCVCMHPCMYSEGERCTASASSALLVILRQEIDRFNYLLCVVRSSLLSFSASIRGEVLMSEALEEVYTALLTMIVPSDWKVGLHCPAHHDRTIRLEGRSTLPCFLTAVLQNSARQKNVPVDSLSFTYHVQPMDESSSNWSKRLTHRSSYSGCSIVHIFVLDCLPVFIVRAHITSLLPLVGQVSEDAVAVPTTESPGDLQFYDCPLYRTFKRAGFLSSSGISTNFITSVSLPTLECPTHWVFRGTALLCQPNE